MISYGARPREQPLVRHVVTALCIKSTKTALAAAVLLFCLHVEPSTAAYTSHRDRDFGGGGLGLAKRLRGEISGFDGFLKGSSDKQNARAGGDEHHHRPKRHRLLGLQVVAASLLLLFGYETCGWGIRNTAKNFGPLVTAAFVGGAFIAAGALAWITLIIRFLVVGRFL